MTTNQLEALGPDDTFQFACHPQVPCFNQCCRDLNQALTPYDVLRLRVHQGMASGEFLQRHVSLNIGPATGLPIASLRFADRQDRLCPFVSDQGCSVYEARPASCRLYPLVRALSRSRLDGTVTEHYAILHEPHCRGFAQSRKQNVRQWIADQELEAYHRHNNALLELIALKNRHYPGPLPPTHQQWATWALYDIDQLKQKALSHQLTGMDEESLTAIPELNDDEQWLHWSLRWIRWVLFGKTA